jgi:anthranilate/para-aminobenzoate synthase component II
MAIRHRTWPLHGVQFHPESFLTLCGSQLLRRFVELAPPRAARRPLAAAS